MMSLISCTIEDIEYIPFYQDAIYLLDADGNNKQKIIDVNICRNVQFIPNSNKILFMTARFDGSYMEQIHTINTDGSDSTQISHNYLLREDQPAISEDGTKIVFWALDETRDADYDLFLTDPLGLEIINLTNTQGESEKDASFIHYQNQEYLLYVTYSSINNSEFSTISIMNTTTFEVDTLYVEEVEDVHRYLGFRKPIYDSNNDILFSMFDYSLLEYSSLESGDSTYISTCGLISPMELSINNQLLFYLNGIRKYDYSLNQIEINFFVDGYWFDSLNEEVIYSSGRHLSDSDIFSIKLDGSQNMMLAEDGIYPRFSDDGTQIVYIGQYVTNPRRNLITN